LRLSPEALKKAKDKHEKREKNLEKKSFAQVAKGNETNLLKLHKTFLTLPAKKIIEMNNISSGKTNIKPKIQITTKGPSRKNILIPINANNKDCILNNANTHVSQLNTLFKSYKSTINTNCIRESWNGITITTNTVASPSDLNIIKQYFKGIDNLEAQDISPRLPQFKSFLKILGVLYFGNNSSLPVDRVIKVE